jgi:hypothetical protein
LAYEADAEDNTFHFGPAHDFSCRYQLPHWLRQPTDAFRVDADVVHQVQWRVEGDGVRIEHRFSRDAIFVATKSPDLQPVIETRRQAAIQVEERNGNFEELSKILGNKQKSATSEPNCNSRSSRLVIRNRRE